MEAHFTGRLAGLSSFAAKTLAHNVDGKDGQPSYVREGMLNAHAVMKPGNNLTQTTRASLELLAPSIDKLGRSSSAQNRTSTMGH